MKSVNLKIFSVKKDVPLSIPRLWDMIPSPLLIWFDVHDSIMEMLFIVDWIKDRVSEEIENE